jgi:hypothetical protein
MIYSKITINMNNSSLSKSTLLSALILGGFMFFSTYVTYASNPASHKEPVKEIVPAENNQEKQSISRDRLLDPGYDVRFNRGVVHPWHDTKSIYLRRTIPISQLA